MATLILRDKKLVNTFIVVRAQLDSRICVTYTRTPVMMLRRHDGVVRQLCGRDVSRKWRLRSRYMTLSCVVRCISLVLLEDHWETWLAASVSRGLKLQLHSPEVCGDFRPNTGGSIDCLLNLNVSSLTTQQSTQNAQWSVNFQPWHWLGIQAAIESLFISVAGLGYLEGDSACWRHKPTIKLGHLSGSFPLEVSHISSTGSGTHKFAQNLLTDLILKKKKSPWIPHKALESIARLRDFWMMLLHFFF